MTMQAQSQLIIEPRQIAQPNNGWLVRPDGMKASQVRSQRCRDNIGVATIIFRPCREMPVTKPVQLFRIDGIDCQSPLGQSFHQSAARNFNADHDPAYLPLTQTEQPINELRHSRTRMLNRAF